jgi:hypothetical protein
MSTAGQVMHGALTEHVTAGGFIQQDTLRMLNPTALQAD